ncbi:MAG: glycosyl hydrolase family 28-related protein, partial [Planctomycetota bacterium]
MRTLITALTIIGVLAAPAAADRRTIDAAKHVDRSLPDCGIQKAIDEAAGVEGGAIVKLPAGTFALRRGLVIKDNVELAGAGMDKTILTPARTVTRLDLTRDGPDADGKVWL